MNEEPSIKHKLGIAIPFGILTLINLFCPHKVDWMTFVLAFLAASPWLLPLFAANFDEFAISLQGISGKTRRGTATAAEVEAASPPPPRALAIAPAVAPEAAPNQPPAFTSLLPQTRKVLKTLWKFQQQQFPNDNSKRWGFTVGIRAPDYMAYSLGLLEAIRFGFVAVDARGFSFLTDVGLAYCQQQDPAIAAETEFYGTFSN